MTLETTKKKYIFQVNSNKYRDEYTLLLVALRVFAERQQS
jgi:hypothetical protein